MHTDEPGHRGPAAQPRRSCRPTTRSRPPSPAAPVPAVDGRQGRRRHVARGRRPRSRTLERAGDRHGRADRAGHIEISPDKTVATVVAGREGQRHRRGVGALARRPARRRRPGDGGQAARRRGRGDRLHRRVEGLQRRDGSHLPLVFAFVLTLAFILLLVTFRSIVIPIKAIVLNLLSVGAAYGVLKLVFQDGRRGRARLPVGRRHHVLAAAVPLRDPLRPVDGLPRVHPQPDPRGGRPRRCGPTRRSRTGSRARPASSRAPRPSWSRCSRSSRR